MDRKNLQNDDLFKLGVEVAELIIAKPKAYQERERHKTIQLFFFAKAYKTFQAITWLSDKGYPEDCMVLIRTMFEILMQSVYLSQDPEERSERFFAYTPVSQTRYFRRLKKHSVDETKNYETEGIEELERQREKVRHLFKREDNWTGISIFDLAQKVGMEKEYGIIYFHLSHYAHTSQSMLLKYVRREDDMIELNLNPSAEEDLTVGYEATRLLINVCRQVDTTFGFEFDKLISENLVKIYAAGNSIFDSDE